MTISQLTDYQQRRFKKNNICPICRKQIKNEEFEMLTTKSGRLVRYNFFHTSCLIEDCEKNFESHFREECGIYEEATY